MIYNGRATGDCGAADFNPDSGSVSIIDTDGNGSYDVVSITSYDVLIAESASNSMLTFKYGGTAIDLNPDGRDFECKVIKDGKEIAASEVSEWDVCSVKQTKDGKKCGIYVSDLKITGLVTEISEDYIKADGSEYEISKSYRAAAAAENAGVLRAEVGDEFILLFDLSGRIAGVNKAQTADYGYLISAEQREGLSERMSFKLCTAQNGGEVKKYENAEHIKLNGRELKKIIDEPALYDAAAGKFKAQPVIYKLNSDNRLTELSTSTDKFNKTVNGSDNPNYAADYIGYTEGEFTLDFAFTGSMAFRAGDMNTFEAKKTKVAADCKVFMIPNVEDPEDDEFKVYGASYFQNDTYYRNLSFYDVTPDFEAKAVTMLVGAGTGGGQDTIANNTKLAVVDKISRALNYSGEEAAMLNGWCDGKYVSLVASKAELRHSTTVYNSQYNGIELQSLPQGAIIQYEVNSRNELAQIRILFIPAKNAAFFESRGSSEVTAGEMSGALYMGYGRVIKKTKNGIIYNAHSDNSAVETNGTNREWDRNITVRETKKVYLFDRAKGKVTFTDYREIRNDDIVFVQMNYNALVGIVIYR